MEGKKKNVSKKKLTWLNYINVEMSFYFCTENMENYEYDRPNFLDISSSIMKAKSWTGMDISFPLTFSIFF